MTPINMTHTQDAARRALQREAIHAHAAAARAALARLPAYANGLLTLATDDDTDDATLTAAARQARDLRQCAEALAEGLPMEAQR